MCTNSVTYVSTARNTRACLLIFTFDGAAQRACANVGCIFM